MNKHEAHPPPPPTHPPLAPRRVQDFTIDHYDARVINKGALSSSPLLPGPPFYTDLRGKGSPVPAPGAGAGSSGGMHGPPVAISRGSPTTSFVLVPGFGGVPPTPAGSPVAAAAECYDAAHSPLLAAEESLMVRMDDGTRAPASSPVNALANPPKRTFQSNRRR